MSLSETTIKFICMCIMCMCIPNDFHEVPGQEACGHFSMSLPTSPEPFLLKCYAAVTEHSETQHVSRSLTCYAVLMLDHLR